MDNGRGERQDEYGFPSLLAELLGHSSAEGDSDGAAARVAQDLKVAEEPQNALASLSCVAEPYLAVPDHVEESVEEVADVPEVADFEGQSETIAVDVETHGEPEPSVQMEIESPEPLEIPAQLASAGLLSGEDETELLLAQLSALAGDDSLFSAELSGTAFGVVGEEAVDAPVFEDVTEEPAPVAPKKLDWNIGDLPDFSANASEPIHEFEVFEPAQKVPEPFTGPALEVSHEFAHILSDTAEFRIPDFEVPDYLKESSESGKTDASASPWTDDPAERVDPLADTLEIKIPHHLMGTEPPAPEVAPAPEAAWPDDDLLSQLQAWVETPPAGPEAAAEFVASAEEAPAFLFEPEAEQGSGGDFAQADLVAVGAGVPAGATELDDLDLAMPDFSELIGQIGEGELLASLSAATSESLAAEDLALEAIEGVDPAIAGPGEIPALAHAIQADPAVEMVSELPVPAFSEGEDEDLLLAELLGSWESAPLETAAVQTGGQPEPVVEAAPEPVAELTAEAAELSDDDFLASVLAGVGGMAGAPGEQESLELTAGEAAAEPALQAASEIPIDLSDELPSFDELLNFGEAVAGNGKAAAPPAQSALNNEVAGSDLLLEDLLSGLAGDVEPDATQPVRYVPKNKPAERLPDARQELERIVATTDGELASVDGGLFRERRSMALNANRHIAFQAGHRLFALPLDSVLETDLVPRVTYVPGAGSAIRGVANVRGDLLSVVDLRDLLSIEQHDRVHQRLLVVRQGRRAVAGFIIDSVLGIVPVQNEDRQPVPAIAEDPAAPMLDAVVEYRDRLMGVLDANRLVSAAGLEVSQTQ